MISLLVGLALDHATPYKASDIVVQTLRHQLRLLENGFGGWGFVFVFSFEINQLFDFKLFGRRGARVAKGDGL